MNETLLQRKFETVNDKRVTFYFWYQPVNGMTAVNEWRNERSENLLDVTTKQQAYN